MRAPARFRAETKYAGSVEKKANTNLPIMAVVGDGSGGAPAVATRAGNFYWVQIYGDPNRVTQCNCILPLANGDIIYIAKARDRNLTYYEFVGFIQAGGGVAPPVQVHAFLGVAHTVTTPAAPVRGDIIVSQGVAPSPWTRLPIGAANTWLNSNATDATWQSIFDLVVPTTIQCDDVAATGAATVAARRDHRHGIVCVPPVNIGNANAEGVATSFSRSDHVHDHPAGLGVNLHHNEVHLVNSTGPHAEAGLTVGHVLRVSAVAAFSFAAIQAGDLPGLGGVPALTLGLVNAAGAAATYVQTDASIAVFDAVVPTTIQCDDAAAAGVVAFAARRDHTHGIVCAVPDRLVPDNAQAEGVATSFARSDHDHQITCTAPVANLSVASTNAEGVDADDFSRSDHSHAITSSSNPGAAVSLLATDAAGYLQLVALGIRAAPVAAGTITFPDALANALYFVDGTTNINFQQFVTSAGVQATVFNIGEADVDFNVRASAGISDPTDAFFVEGLTGRVFMGEVAPLYTGHVTIEDLAVNTTTEFSGLVVNHTKTGGATDRLDDMFGLRSLIDINDGSEVGWLYGAALTASVTNGTVGNAVTGARSGFGIYGLLSLGNASVVTLNAYGLYFGATQQAGGSIAGDFYAAYLTATMAGTVTGTAYMLYMNEVAGIDYGIYQSGTAANVLGGKLTLSSAEIEFTAASGSNLIEFPNNVADALHFVDVGDANDYLTFVSTNGAREVVVNQDGHANIGFRVEAAGVPNALRVLSAVGYVGVGVVPLWKFHVEASWAGVTVGCLIRNTDNTNLASHAAFDIRSGGPAAGDAFINMTVEGTYQWQMGVDNSDADKFKIAANADLGGAGDALVITAARFFGLGGVTAPGTRLDIGAGALTLAEMAAPGAGAVNTCRLYCVDNGGKTELYAIFNTGAAQLIAAQP